MARVSGWLLLFFVILSIGLGAEVWRLLRTDRGLQAHLNAVLEAEKKPAKFHEQRSTTIAGSPAVSRKPVIENTGATFIRGGSPFIEAWKKIQEKMRHDPAAIALRHRSNQIAVQTNYGDLLAAMQLPPDKLARLKALMVERLDSDADARDAATDMGATDSKTLNDAASQASADVNQDIQGLLGDADYARFRDLSALQGPLRGVREQYVTPLAYAGTPLSTDQSVALAQVVHNVWNTKTNPDYPVLVQQQPDPQTGLTTLDQEVLQQSSAFLSPEQSQVIKQSQVANHQTQDYYQRMNAMVKAALNSSQH